MRTHLTLTPLSNRQSSSSGDWYHLVPVGEYPHPDSQLIQVIDEQAIQQIANRFTADASAPNYAGLLIDQEHFSYDPDKSSAAYGWVRRVENRATGLWGQVEWTSLGAQALKDKTYKFISPVWLPRDTEPVTNRADNVRRPLRLDSLGLTNQPNLRGMVPLVNRSTESTPTGGKPVPKNMTRVAAHLGLAAEASEEAILAAVTALTNRATQAESRVTPLTNRITQLEGELQTVNNAVIDHDLAPLANRATPEEIASWRKSLLANRADTLPLLKGMITRLTAPAATAQPGNNGQSARTPITNRAKTPDERDANAPITDPQAVSADKARVISNRARELVKASGNKRNYTECFEQAKAEVLTSK